MNPSIIAAAEASSEKYYYSQELAPNEVVWLTLALPVQSVGCNAVQHLKINIANTLIFGFGHNGILLTTDAHGFVSSRYDIRMMGLQY
jgi:hypothetical protein